MSSATDKIARVILSGESGDYDLANYDTAQVDTLVKEVRLPRWICSETFDTPAEGRSPFGMPPSSAR